MEMEWRKTRVLMVTFLAIKMILRRSKNKNLTQMTLKKKNSATTKPNMAMKVTFLITAQNTIKKSKRSRKVKKTERRKRRKKSVRLLRMKTSPISSKKESLNKHQNQRKTLTSRRRLRKTKSQLKKAKSHKIFQKKELSTSSRKLKTLLFRKSLRIQ